jgi:hypothetical protein
MDEETNVSEYYLTADKTMNDQNAHRSGFMACGECADMTI